MRRFDIDIAQALAVMVDLARERTEPVEAVAREIIDSRHAS
jgi:hypothetical protein